MKSTSSQKISPTDLVLGVDIGGTRIKCAWFSAATGHREGTCVLPTRDCAAAEGTPAFAEDVRTQIGQIEQKLERPFVGIGIAAPGLASPDQRRIICMPGRLGGLANLDWNVLLQRSHAVPVVNDAHAALLGEVWQGAAKDLGHVVMLTLGTGVGGAILTNGRLLTGSFGRAGHLGHVSLERRGSMDIVGTPGSLEEAIGECTLARRSDNRFESTLGLITALEAGDPHARIVWMHSIDALAAALVSFINALDPERIVIGGGIAQAGAVLFDPLRWRMDQIEWRPLGRAVPIVPAQLDDWGGACGAAWTALNANSSR
jgi:glucokinase